MAEQGSPTPPVSWQAPVAGAGPAPGIEFAPHGARLVAYIVDGLIAGLVIGLITAVAIVLLFRDVRVDPVTGTVDPATVTTGDVLLFVVLMIVVTLIGLLYFPFFWVRGGQTPGMRLFGLHVVRDRDGGPIGWGTAFVRMIGLYVSTLVFYLGFIWIFIDKRRRGWQDLIAGTIVIKRT